MNLQRYQTGFGAGKVHLGQPSRHGGSAWLYCTGRTVSGAVATDQPVTCNACRLSAERNGIGPELGLDLGLKHANRIEALLNRRDEARALHLAHVDAELERSKSEPINLSDLTAGAEAFSVDRINRRKAR